MGLALELDAKGRPLATIENLELLLVHHGVKHRFNIASTDCETVIDGTKYKGPGGQKVALDIIKSWAKEINFPVTLVSGYLGVIATRNKFKPNKNDVFVKYGDRSLSRNDPITERILKRYAWDKPALSSWKTLSEVAREIGFKNIYDQHETRFIARVLRKLECKQMRTNKFRFFQVPPKQEHWQFS